MDVKSVSGNITTNEIKTTLPDGQVQTEPETSVKSGNMTTHSNVTTLPDGQVQTSGYTDVQRGNRVLIEGGSQPGANGHIEKYTGVKRTDGDRTDTSKTFTMANGLVKTTNTVIMTFGDAGQTRSSRPTRPTARRSSRITSRPSRGSIHRPR